MEICLSILDCIVRSSNNTLVKKPTEIQISVCLASGLNSQNTVQHSKNLIDSSKINTFAIDNFRYGLNFNQGKKNEISQT